MKIGNRFGMWGVLIAMTALSPLAAHAAEAPASGCRLAKVGELPLKFENNRPLVTLSINGKPADFLIDTGAEISVMYKDAVTANNLSLVRSTDIEMAGVGGIQAAGLTTIASLKMARFEMNNVQMVVLERGKSSERAGLLGRELLGQIDLEMDFAANTIRLFKSENCGGQSLAYWTQTPEIADMRHDSRTDPFKIDVLVNGHRVDAILDSGAQTSVITQGVAELAGVRPIDYAPGTDTSFGTGPKAVHTRVAVFDTVTIGDEQIKHAKLRVGNFFAADTGVPIGSHIPRSIDGLPEMLLGADFFRSHRVMLVTSQKRVYFTYSGGPVFQVVGDAVKPSNTSAAPPATSASAAPAQP